MIDFKAINNYISTQFTHEYNVLIVKKTQPYALTAINEANFNNSRGEINIKTLNLLITMGKYHEEIIFDVIRLVN